MIRCARPTSAKSSCALPAAAAGRQTGPAVRALHRTATWRPCATSSEMLASRDLTEASSRNDWRRPLSMRSHIHDKAWRLRRLSQRPSADWRTRKSSADSHKACTPWPDKALSCNTRGVHGWTSCAACAGLPCWPISRSEDVICAWARVAAPGSRSALLISTRSASSITPFLIACNSSPALGSCINTNMSVMPATATSLCPTPTVSTITTS